MKYLLSTPERHRELNVDAPVRISGVRDSRHRALPGNEQISGITMDGEALSPEGRSMIAAVDREGPHLICMSGHVRVPFEGFFAFLEKPIGYPLLLRTIAEAVGRNAD
jgi:hypothetical protein